MTDWKDLRMPQETWVASRVKHEREERGWSLETVAKAMTEIGCSIPASAIFKIEKGNPPRKISLNEFLAFSSVFGLDKEDLLQPPEVAKSAATRRLLHEYESALEACREPLQRVLELRQKLSLDYPSTLPPTLNLIDAKGDVTEVEIVARAR